MTVIHFADFEDMLPELSLHSPVRVTRLMTPIDTVSKTPGMSDVQIGVHVRQIIHAGSTEILAWMMITGAHYTIYEDQPLDGPDNDKATKAWEQAITIEQLVRERIMQTDANHDIRSGIIDLGGAAAFGGYWSFLQVENENEEEEEVDEESEEPSTPIIGGANVVTPPDHT